MESKVSLLEQLRIERGATPAADPGNVRVWQITAAVLGVLLVSGAGVSAWYLLERPRTATAASAATADSASASADAGTAAATEGAPAAAASVLDASGYIVAQREATVAAKNVYRVSQILIQEGQTVTKGQIVARLDDSNAQAALAYAHAGLIQATANLEAAKVALADQRPIFERDEQQRTAQVISAQDFDNAKITYDNAQTNLDEQQAAVEAARANLLVAQRAEDDTIIRAPFDGVVTDKAAQPGEMVSPMATGGSTRTGICTIVDMSSLEADVDVSESFINRVYPDQPAVVHLNAYPDWAIPASVVAIIPTADRSKATVTVRVGFKVRDPRILPEMGARVSFLAEPEQKKG